VKVYVKTPARLHFGLIDLNGELGRFFGGLGVAVDYPNVILETEQSETFSVTGENSERAATFAKQFLETYNIDSNVNIHVKQAIPEHTGLGSGTQLALAVAFSLSKLFNLNVPLQELSLAMGRMKRTAVGTTVFEQGGFVVDGGKRTKNGDVIPESFPPLIFRKRFSEN